MPASEAAAPIPRRHDRSPVAGMDELILAAPAEVEHLRPASEPGNRADRRAAAAPAAPAPRPPGREADRFRRRAPHRAQRGPSPCRPPFPRRSAEGLPGQVEHDRAGARVGEHALDEAEAGGQAEDERGRAPCRPRRRRARSAPRARVHPRRAATPRRRTPDSARRACGTRRSPHSGQCTSGRSGTGRTIAGPPAPQKARAARAVPVAAPRSVVAPAATRRGV